MALAAELRFTQRKPIRISEETLVTIVDAQPGETLPLLVQRNLAGVNLNAWVSNHQQFVADQLLKHGAILFRNFDVVEANKFEEFIRTVSGEPLEYKERSSPRSQVSGKVYTSTDYPRQYSIFLHNENSYQRTWPAKIFFCCATPAEQGGETPLADCRKVYGHLSAAVRDAFVKRNWMYVRNFSNSFGLPWQEVFQTSDKTAVEQHCRRAGIEAEWLSDQQLRIRAVRPALARHPRTNELVWFNHATFFHVSTLEPRVREELLRTLPEDQLPSNSYYGDGGRIEPEVLDQLRDAYKREQLSFRWQKGDVLLLDNMLVAHGRAAYSGARQILAGMAEPLSGEQATV
jgi:alpha-ketoglutarate-dependent taurine dioxygenase